MIEARFQSISSQYQHPEEVRDLLHGQALTRQAAREAMLAEKEKRRTDVFATSGSSANMSAAQRAEQFQSIWMKTIVEQLGEELDAIRKVRYTLLVLP
jgi:hypothetical protein